MLDCMQFAEFIELVSFKLCSIILYYDVLNTELSK